MPVQETTYRSCITGHHKPFWHVNYRSANQQRLTQSVCPQFPVSSQVQSWCSERIACPFLLARTVWCPQTPIPSSLIETHAAVGRSSSGTYLAGRFLAVVGSHFPSRDRVSAFEINRPPRNHHGEHRFGRLRPRCHIESGPGFLKISRITAKCASWYCSIQSRKSRRISSEHTLVPAAFVSKLTISSRFCAVSAWSHSQMPFGLATGTPRC